MNDRDPTTVRKFIAGLLPDKTVRRIRYRNTDVFLLSYPKCGRTWLRLMIGRAISRHFALEVNNLLNLTQFGRFHADVPKIIVHHDDSPQLKQPKELKESKSLYKRGRVIFLVRDPRDVIVSLYYHRKYREHSYQKEVTDFIKEPAGGFETIIRYYNIWAKNFQMMKGFLLVRYEDMHAAPQLVLRSVLRFAGLDGIDEVTIAEAVQFSNFRNMRNMEKEDSFRSKRLRTDSAGNEAAFKTRRGVVGGYLDELNAAEIDFLNERMKELSDFFGYSTTEYKRRTNWTT